MGYQTIQLDMKSKDITAIVTEFGKFQYNVLPVGMVMSGDIFHVNVNKLFSYVEVVKAYIYSKQRHICGSRGTTQDFFLTSPQSRSENHRQKLQLCIKGDTLSRIRYHKGRSQTLT